MRTRALISTLAFLAIYPAALRAADPSVSVSWRSITLPNITLSEPKPNQTLSEGPVDIDLTNPRLDIQLTGLEIANGKLFLRTAHAELRFAEIKGRNLLIAKVPHITVHTVRKEKVIFGKRIAYDDPVTETTWKETRTETTLFTFTNPAVIADKREGADWAINLPAEIPMELAKQALRLTDSRAVVTALHVSIDESFSDARLEESVTFRLENVPSLIEAIARRQKPALFTALRDALKKEVEKPEFLQKLEAALSRQLPVLSLEEGQALPALVKLQPDANGFSTVAIGTPLANPTEASAELISLTNSDGLNLIVRSLLAGIAQRRIHLGTEKALSIDEAAGRLVYTPTTPREAVQLADIVSQMSGATITGPELEAIGLDLTGTRIAPEATIAPNGTVSLKVGVAVLPKERSQNAVYFTARFQFSVDASGALALDRIQAEQTGKNLSGTGFPLYRAFQAEMKLRVAALLLNEQLAGLQKGSDGVVKTKFELLRSETPTLKISATR